METARIAAIALQGVTASSGGFRILKETSVAFPEGETSMLLGGAGSGKSTLLKVAAGLVVPDEGCVLWRGRDMHRFSKAEERDFRKVSGFVFQDSALWSNQTIFSNIAMPLRVHRKSMPESEINDRVRTVLGKLGYFEGTSLRPAELSAGEQKLVSIARAVVADPEAVFMDSPTTGLDEDSEERVMQLIAELKAAGKTVIVATNKSELAYRHADNIGVIMDSTVTLFGPYDLMVASADQTLRGVLSRLRARGTRSGRADPAGSEMSNGRDA